MPLELDLLVKGDDWQTLLYPRTTPAIQGVVQQIINCPYQGITKRIYLQGKVMELHLCLYGCGERSQVLRPI